MKYKIATIHVSGTEVRVTELKPITKGITGAVVEIIYDDPMWTALKKKVAFEGVVTVEDTYESSIVPFPAEVATTKNTFIRVGVTGVNVDEIDAIPTLWADLGTVRDSAYGDHPLPGEPTPPLWAKLLAMIGQLANLHTDAKDNLVSAINEVLSKVGNGGGNVDLSGYVKTVNGTAPDENGNVEIAVPDSSQNGNGLSDTSKALLITILRNAVYGSDQSANITALEKALASSGGEVEPDEPVVPDDPKVTLTGISSVYSGGSVVAGTAVNELTGIVVTAHYSDGTSDAVTEYTLSGEIAVGENTITVTYQGMSTTFTVTGVAERGGEVDSEELMCAENIVATGCTIACLADNNSYDVAEKEGSNIYAIPVEQGATYEVSLTTANPYGHPYWGSGQFKDVSAKKHFSVSNTILADFSAGRHSGFTFDANATVDNSTSANKINNGDGTYTNKIYFTPAVSGYIHVSSDDANKGYVYSVKKVVT